MWVGFIIIYSKKIVSASSLAEAKGSMNKFHLNTSNLKWKQSNHHTIPSYLVLTTGGMLGNFRTQSGSLPPSGPFIYFMARKHGSASWDFTSRRGWIIYFKDIWALHLSLYTYIFIYIYLCIHILIHTYLYTYTYTLR